MNIQLGAGTASSATDTATVTHPKVTMLVAGAGISVNVPTPGLSIEPYLSVGNRWNKPSGVSGTQSNVGWVVGAYLGFGMLGLGDADDSSYIGGRSSWTVAIDERGSLKSPSV